MTSLALGFKSIRLLPVAALLFGQQAAIAANSTGLTCLNDRPIKRSELPAPNQDIAKVVTLAGIKATPGLSEKLQGFFDGREWSEKSVFVNRLHGRRKDLSKCWSLMNSTIDIPSCEASKEAGESRLQIANGRAEFFVDTDNESTSDAVPLTSLCTDGQMTLRFKFLYYKEFGPAIHRVVAGPWEYTVIVNKTPKGMTSITTARVVVDDRGGGAKHALHSSPIAVDHLEPSSDKTQAGGKRQAPKTPLTQ